ncbi:hypothetical protein Ancab_034458 [Ancistrocladus abbreviatus]
MSGIARKAYGSDAVKQEQGQKRRRGTVEQWRRRGGEVAAAVAQLFFVSMVDEISDVGAWWWTYATFAEWVLAVMKSGNSGCMRCWYG